MWSKESDLDPNMTFSKQLKSVFKLGIILLSYTLAFVTMVRFGFWTFEVRQMDKESPSVWSCFKSQEWGPCYSSHILKLAFINVGLLLIFGLQHTFMSQRKLLMTKYWQVFHYSLEIDKAVYNFMTALALQLVMSFWQPIGVSLWEIGSINKSPYLFHFTVHVIAWGIFYGTNLMIDFPDLIGLNQQVVIECPNNVAKSPELRTMIQNQRHMGLIPLAVILLVHPFMSVDRFLLMITLLAYTYFSWKSQTCYPYAKSMRRVKQCSVYNHDD
ncbi:unnamed protein product [Allacma fusca]|uniref:Nuclear envelope membrane protein n=1 Tax=Allacma fusca TaxID=39272 RepID=A0A8J2PF32_9HEXA|nr:unnamed protein product [Allacma fusca]